MNIDLIISADDIKKEKIINKSVLIIDILRATSVIITALNNGCKKAIPVLTVEEAQNKSSKNRNEYILGGERKALKIEGFDFSNSPLEYKKELVKDKILIITTSNGTRAIKGSEGADNILLGAFINANSAADKLVDLGKDIVIVNSGTDGQFSMDDFICSGYIIDCILKKVKADLTDISKTALYIYRENKDITGFMKHAKHYNRIKKLGLEEDLKYCCQKDIIKIVPYYKDGVILK